MIAHDDKTAMDQTRKWLIPNPELTPVMKQHEFASICQELNIPLPVPAESRRWNEIKKLVPTCPSLVYLITMDYTFQRYGESLLHYASRINNYSLMKELLTRGEINVNVIEVIISFLFFYSQESRIIIMVSIIQHLYVQLWLMAHYSVWKCYCTTRPIRIFDTGMG